jgi:creatinine amidohydrolase
MDTPERKLPQARRRFLGRLAAAGMIGASVTHASSQVQAADVPGSSGETSAAGKETAGSAASREPRREVRLERLRPAEIDRAMQDCPTLFQPLGTIEWHGLHNIAGLDAVKAHHLCVRAAQRGAGLVAPSLYGGVGGLDQPHTFVIEPENDIHSVLLRAWLERLCREAVRQGFRAVILLTGHYGAAQQMVVRETAVRMSRALDVPVLGTPEYFLALDAGYLGDHAAWGETALMMELDPESVDLSRLGNAPHRGVGGRDPKEATRADGRRLTEAIVSRLAKLARRMPQWNAATRNAFLDAESALVERQIALAASEKNVWAAWRHIGKGAFSQYAQLLVDEKFDRIVELTRAL